MFHPLLKTKKPLHVGKGFNHYCKGDDRIRTGDKGFADLCLATWPRRQQKKSAGMKPADFLRAGDEIRTRGLLLGKETFYH
jgi:hypothetical protein